MAVDGIEAYKLFARLLPGPVLDIGCSVGASEAFLLGTGYVGIDPLCWREVGGTIRGKTEDEVIAGWREKERSRPGTKYFKVGFEEFLTTDIWYNTIVCFEVLEHYTNGLELAERLKMFCDHLLISVPYKESEVAAARNGHVLHGLDYVDFPGFRPASSSPFFGRMFLGWERGS